MWFKQGLKLSQFSSFSDRSVQGMFSDGLPGELPGASICLATLKELFPSHPLAFE